jgi:ferritin
MDLLAIHDDQGFFCLPERDEKVVSQVTVQDISDALELILQNGDVCISLDKDSDDIKNPAQKIVFVQLRSSFKEVLESREAIMSGINDVFESAEKKYLTQNDPSIASNSDCDVSKQ